MTQSRRRARRQSTGTHWPKPLGIGVAIIAAIVVVLAVWTWSRTSSPSRAGGVALGATVPPTALAATTGGPLALPQLRGAKIVLYFYEGAG